MHCATAYKTITWTITYTAFKTAISAKNREKAFTFYIGANSRFILQ